MMCVPFANRRVWVPIVCHQSKDAVHMSTLVFFPWLRLKAPITAKDFTLLSYERGRAPAGPGSLLQDTLDAITKPYVTCDNPIQYATLVQVAERDLIHDLDEQERN